MRRNKISETISNIDQSYVNEATEYTGTAKTAHRPAWMKWGAIAACFALIAVLGIGVFQSGLFGDNEHIATLENGNTINFVKSDSGVGQLDIAYEITTRDLTSDETTNLFGGLPVTGYVLFNKENDSVLGIEGKYDDMKLIVSAPNVMLNDTVVDGENKVSNVDGINVNAGYFISGKNIIYYATFALGDNIVYIENAGSKDGDEKLKSEITTAIQNLIELEQIDLLSINK